jgi:Tfp pilus assembly protein PilF
MRDEDATRVLLPRWRSLTATLVRGEFADLRGFRPDAATATRQVQLEGDFARDGTLESATDLLAFAVAYGDVPSAAAVRASELVESRANPKTAVHALATRVLSRDKTIPIDQGITPRERMIALKSRVRSNSRDALSWIELARWYTVLGQVEPARRCMLSAVSLVDSHRYVLRSAARFLCHVGDPERAQRLLEGATCLRRDPWLMASHVAVCDLQGRASQFSMHIKKVLLSGPVGFNESELAAALGTVELDHGSVKKARKLLRASVVMPAENAIAQVEWINRARGERVVLPDAVVVNTRCFEALAWRAACNGAVAEAVSNCTHWLDEEPFSVKPAMFGSFFGVVSGECLEAACELARRGAQANPDNVILANNYVVALAELGELEQAANRMARIRFGTSSSEVRITLKATAGMLAFRAGHVEEGTARYSGAIKEATELRDLYLERLARVHLLIEQLRIGVTPGGAAVAFVTEIESAPELGLRLAAKRAQKLLENKGRAQEPQPGRGSSPTS